MISEAPAFQKATLEVRSPRPHVALVVLAGEHDLYSGDELQQTFDQSLAVCDHLIVDLSAAEFIDSTIAAVLLQTRKNASELDRKFNVVLGTAPVVERVLEVTGVVQLLNVVPSVERALFFAA
jgi:anti-sigma B factor antagonist